MKKIYLLIVFTLVCLFLSGCEANYKINIDEDLNVSEEITFNYDLDDYQVTEEDEEVSIPSMIEEITTQATKEGYEYFNTSNESNINLLFKKKSSFDTFKSSIFDGIYSYFDSHCNENKCSITSIAKQSDIEGDGTYMNYKIYITVPYKVLKQNADEFDLKNNTYIWYYIVGGKQSNIEFIFEKQGKNVIEINKRNSNIMLVVYIIIGGLVLGFIGLTVRKIIRNNRPGF